MRYRRGADLLISKQTQVMRVQPQMYRLLRDLGAPPLAVTDQTRLEDLSGYFIQEEHWEKILSDLSHRLKVPDSLHRKMRLWEVAALTPVIQGPGEETDA